MAACCRCLYSPKRQLQRTRPALQPSYRERYVKNCGVRTCVHNRESANPVRSPRAPEQSATRALKPPYSGAGPKPLLRRLTSDARSAALPKPAWRAPGGVDARWDVGRVTEGRRRGRFKEGGPCALGHTAGDYHDLADDDRC